MCLSVCLPTTHWVTLTAWVIRLWLITHVTESVNDWITEWVLNTSTIEVLICWFSLCLPDPPESNSHPQWLSECSGQLISQSHSLTVTDSSHSWLINHYLRNRLAQVLRSLQLNNRYLVKQFNFKVLVNWKTRFSCCTLDLTSWEILHKVSASNAW